VATNPPLVSRREQLAAKAVLLLGTAAALTLLGVFLERCRYGLDLSDESFYLAWMRAPSTWRASVLLFGFLYHPLYALCRGDLVLLRQVNLLLTFGAAGAAGFSVLGRERRVAAVALSLVLGTSGLLLFQMWLPAPSYNGLALHALCLAAAGMALAVRQRPRAAAVLIGVSGWLAYMAKPTTAAALGVVVLLALLPSGWKAREVALAAAIAAAGIVASALVIDGGLARHAERIVQGATLLDTLKSGHSVGRLLRWDPLVLGPLDLPVLLAATLVVATSTRLTAGPGRAQRWVGLGLTAVLALVALGAVLGLWRLPLAPRPALGLQILAAPVGLLLAVFAQRAAQPVRHVRRADVALATGIALLPFVHAFGTSATYWAASARAGVFWVLAAVALARAAADVAWPALLPAASYALVVTAALLALAVEKPIRQLHPLREDAWTEDVTGSGRPVLLSEEVGTYLRQLRQVAAAGGFAAGDPFIDLTGHAPGALFVLKAHSLGQPWIIGGYEGSSAFAQAALAAEPCEDLARAWVLVEEGGPRRIPVDVLAPFGIDGRRDLVSVGAVWAPPGQPPRPYVQRLLRPLRDPVAAEGACRSARAGAP